MMILMMKRKMKGDGSVSGVAQLLVLLEDPATFTPQAISKSCLAQHGAVDHLPVTSTLACTKTGPLD